MGLNECQTCHRTLKNDEYSFSMKFYKKPLCRPCQSLERNINEYTITSEQEKEIDKLVDNDCNVLFSVIRSFGYSQVNLIQKRDYEKIYEKLKKELWQERLNENHYSVSSNCCYGGDNLDIALEAGMKEEAIWG